MFFLELSCFLHGPEDVGNLISGSSVFSKTSLNIREFTVHVLLKPSLENFEHSFTSMWDECNCVVVWAFFGIAFLWDWNEDWPFPVLWPLLSFPNLLAYWGQHFHSIIFQDLKQLNWKSNPSRALFIVMLSKAHLTSLSKMSGSRLVITPSWLSGSWRSFLYSSSVYSCHLFLISSASVRSIPFLSFINRLHYKPVAIRARCCVGPSFGYRKIFILCLKLDINFLLIFIAHVDNIICVIYS